jgi:hypothetical protein
LADSSGQTLMVVRKVVERIAELSESKGLDQDQTQEAARQEWQLPTGLESHCQERDPSEPIGDKRPKG